MIELAGWEVSQQALLVGAAQGLGYALLAVGLVLVYRATGVVNFAQAEIGVFASTLAALLIGNYGLPYWLALGAGVAAGAGWALAIELIVVRRLFHAPRVVLLVATVGVAQLVFLATLHLPATRLTGAYPTAVDAEVSFGQLQADGRVLSLVLLSLPAVVGVALMLARTRFGVSMRAAAENPEAARLVGISPRKVSTGVWCLAGGFAGLTAVLLAPFEGGTAAAYQQTGPGLLLRVLAVALLARMRSLRGCVLGGLAMGMAQAVILRNTADQPGTENLFLLLVVLTCVLFNAGTNPRDRAEVTNRSTPIAPAFPVGSPWWLRRHGVVVTGAALAAAVALPFFADRPSQLLVWSQIALFTVVVVSATILAGWAGQLSLGQFAFFGLGACTTVVLSNGYGLPVPFGAFELSLTLDFSLAVLAGAAMGALAAVVVGLPALRVRGLMLAIATLAFATAAETWLFRQDFWTDGRGRVPPLSRPEPFGSPHAFYYLCLGLAVLTVAIALWLRRNRFGRALIAMRDNEPMAAAATLSPARTKLVAFAFSGGLSALAGGLFALLLRGFSPEREFTALHSLDVVAMAVIGGLGSVPGAVLGALWVLGLPALFGHNETVSLATSGIGLLVLLMYLPEGLAGVFRHARDSILRTWTTRHPLTETAGQTEPAAPAGRAAPSLAARPAPPVPGNGTAERTLGGPTPGTTTLALRAEAITVHRGHRAVLEQVGIQVAPGELVALIGTNGAGKSTLLDAIGGFVPATGRIEVFDRRVDRIAPHRRHTRLARGFQAARLYPRLTVWETVQVPLDARRGASRGASRGEAGEILDHLGLGRYADQPTGTLSTGVRRLVELAGLLAAGQQMLLLDEPTAGVAQREAELFGPLLERIQHDLGAAVLLVEHDMPLVTAISDRAYCLEAGRVIAEGSPADLVRDPVVISSYLGSSHVGPADVTTIQP